MTTMPSSEVLTDAPEDAAKVEKSQAFYFADLYIQVWLSCTRRQLYADHYMIYIINYVGRKHTVQGQPAGL